MLIGELIGTVTLLLIALYVAVKVLIEEVREEREEREEETMRYIRGKR